MKTVSKNISYTGAGKDLSVPTQSSATVDILNTSIDNYIVKTNVSTLPTSNEATNVAISDPTTIEFNKQVWQMEVSFNNFDQDVYKLSPKAITQLCIEDDLLSWPLRGYIIVNNTLEGFERSFKDIFYHVRSDGRDEITIKLIPKNTGSQSVSEKIWNITFTGCIYDVEDIAAPNRALKMKKFYFWDKRFQFLQEKNIEWSTATGKRFKTSKPQPPISQTSDFKRGMLTGEAIASILSEAGYEEYIDLSNWDWGYSVINYTAKTEWSIWDNIQYILKHHISEQKQDICILKWDRGTEMWRLIPIYKLYEKAGKSAPGELQREHLFFEDYNDKTLDGTDNIPTVPDPFKAPWLDSPSWDIDIKSTDYSKILSYRFSQPSGLDSSQALVTKPIYSHWHLHKQFDIDVTENEIQRVKNKHIKPLYVEKLLSIGNYPVLPLNATKKDQKSIQPEFSPCSTILPDNDRKIRSLLGRGKILQAGIFLNQCMTARLQGISYRQSGTFVGVDRIHESSTNDYDYQLCGQYLVTNVKHIFQQNKYVNDIVMVKIHAYKKLRDNEDIE